MSIIVEGIGLPVNGCLGCHYRTGEFCGILEHHDRVWEYAEMFKRNPYCPIEELIHCKDCKHHINSECEMWDYISTADDYWCKDGEKKEK